MVNRILRRLLATLVLVALVHGAAWLGAVELLRHAHRAWVEARRAEGWVIRHDVPIRQGWPLAAGLRMDAVVAEAPASLAAPGAVVRLETLELAVAATEPWLLRFRAVEARAEIPGRSRVVANGAVGQARIRGAREGEVTLTSVTADEGGAASSVRLVFEADGSLILAGRDIDLPPRATVPLGQRVGLVKARVRTVPTWPGTDPLAWRDRAARLHLDSLVLEWGALRATGSAALALDASLQPEGEARLDASGLPEVVGALAGAGVLAPRDAALARLALAGLQRRPTGGGPSYVPIELGLSDQRLTVNGFALGQVPFVAWSVRQAPIRSTPLAP